MMFGSCHCKTVLFQIDAELLQVRYCYCETCRKLSGADYSCVARVDPDAFSITRGEESLLCYDSKPGKHRYYCPTCFAPIYVENDAELGFLRVRLGLLDGRPEVEVTGHMWVSEKPSWRTISDQLPVYQYEYTGQ